MFKDDSVFLISIQSLLSLTLNERRTSDATLLWLHIEFQPCLQRDSVSLKCGYVFIFTLCYLALLFTHWKISVFSGVVIITISLPEYIVH